MGEQPIYSTKAHVFQIDPETKKKWLPVSSQAVTVSFYHDSVRNSYRIISMDGSKAIINSTLQPNMSFAKTSQKFGQWIDQRVNTVYGLGFNSEAELTKFMDKFSEVKELVKELSTPVDVQVVPTQANFDNNHSNGMESGHVGDHVSGTVRSEPEKVSVPAVNSSSSAVSVADAKAIEQLMYDNDRLKMALAQSSSNAKKWEQDMQTLRSNNQRLTTALQESNVNVEEWKKQLLAYKEENARIKARLTEMEKSSGNAEMLQRQLLESKSKQEEYERLVAQKQEEVNDLKRRLDEMKQMDAQCQKLTTKIQVLEDDKMKTRQQLTELQSQLDQTQSLRNANRQNLLSAQQQISTKINELYEMNDKLADLLQSTI